MECETIRAVKGLGIVPVCPEDWGYTMAIYVNQVGYYRKGEKRAVLTFPCESYRIVDPEGKVCYEGRTDFYGFDKSSGDQVTIADFTEFEAPGTYRVCASASSEEAFREMEESPCFVIQDRVYDKLMYDMMRAFYYLRCGCKLEGKQAGKFVHGACHVGIAQLWEDPSVTGEVCGGWHDAGDYGRYITAGACALSHLLYAYKLYPEVFQDLQLNIPESGNRVPDILNECRYELEWFLKLQREDGSVYHKATTARHAAFVMPEQDLGQMYLLPVSSMATADFAAICAMASCLYREFDTVFADRLLRAAEKSYDWLTEHPEFLGFKNPEGCGTGEYGERDDYSNRFWAAAELYAGTGQQKYHEDMKKALEKPFPLAALGYGEVGGFGMLAYLLCDREKEKDLEDKFLEEFAREGARRIRVSQECGYGVSMLPWEYCWGSNMGVMKQGMIFAIVDHFGLEEKAKAASVDIELPRNWRMKTETEDTEPEETSRRVERDWSIRDYAAAQLDYLLGLNAMGTSYVTGNGEKAFCHPHLRPAYADGIEECMPGMVSGGPSGKPVDECARELIAPDTPPMKVYVDDYRSYSTNEVTIYWNSAAVFTLAYLMKKELEK